MAKKSKSFFNGFCVFATVMVVIVLFCLFALFSLHPEHSIPELEAKDWAVQSNIILKVLPTVYKAQPNDVATIILSESDIQSLLKFAANGNNLAALFSPNTEVKSQSYCDYKLDYKSGRFYIDYAYPILGFVVINLSTQATIELKEYNDFKFYKSFAGYYPLSGAMLEVMAIEFYKTQSNNQQSSAYPYIKAVKSIERLPDHALKITYYPDLLRQQLNKFVRF